VRQSLLCEIWDLKLSLNLVYVFLEFSGFRSELTADIWIESRAEKEVYNRFKFLFLFSSLPKLAFGRALFRLGSPMSVFFEVSLHE